jgi:hypothetical protein
MPTELLTSGGRQASEAERSEAKRSGAKRSEAKRSEAKRSEAKRSEAKRSEAKRSEASRLTAEAGKVLLGRRQSTRWGANIPVLWDRGSTPPTKRTIFSQ